MKIKINNQSLILLIIVIAQFAATSVWFSVNAILSNIQLQFNLPVSIIATITSSVQFGFIMGTLLFALKK